MEDQPLLLTPCSLLLGATRYGSLMPLLLIVKVLDSRLLAVPIIGFVCSRARPGP